jgi:hypothetical protein
LASSFKALLSAAIYALWIKSLRRVRRAQGRNGLVIWDEIAILCSRISGTACVASRFLAYAIDRSSLGRRKDL